MFIFVFIALLLFIFFFFNSKTDSHKKNAFIYFQITFVTFNILLLLNSLKVNKESLIILPITIGLLLAHFI